MGPLTPDSPLKICCRSEEHSSLKSELQKLKDSHAEAAKSYAQELKKAKKCVANILFRGYYAVPQIFI